MRPFKQDSVSGFPDIPYPDCEGWDGDGDYVLKATWNDGSVEYHWELENI